RSRAMAAAARWCYRGDPQEAQSAPLVQFSNGKLRNSENMDFTLYKSKDTTNPRKKHQRILTTETDRLSYVGKNFGSGILKCNSLCRYFVGVLDKDAGQMEVYNAELFNMQPLLSAFGTNKQKRALNSRRMHQVGSETLNVAVTKAAENIIETKGVAGKLHRHLSDGLVYLLLPQCGAWSKCSLLFLKTSSVLSPAEYEALQTPAAAFVSITPEEILKKTEEKSHCSFVLEELKSMPPSEDRADHKARCLWFLDALIKFSFQKVIKKKYALGPDCPHVINSKLMKNFTALTYNNGSIQNLISASMKAKITAYVIALALHINNFQTDLTVLQRDMKLREKRILEIAKAMRLKISKSKGPSGLTDNEDHKLATLSLPLPVYKPAGRQRKRKKMT
uniref:Uncharacterized protein n=1 Tax=Gopherus agassizii TaxID=38772 RepID=A0A452GKK0_9SAUR